MGVDHKVGQILYTALIPGQGNKEAITLQHSLLTYEEAHVSKP